MYDKIEKIGKSLVQHGAMSNRVYLMKLDQGDYPNIIKEMDLLAAKHNYTKIFAKVPEWALDGFQSNGYVKEAHAHKLYKGKQDVYFMSYFVDHSRSMLEKEPHNSIVKNISLALEKQHEIVDMSHQSQFALKTLDDDHIKELSELYYSVFHSYPFPIFEEEYLRKTMNENVVYFGIFDKNKLIAASSAEMDADSQSAEMTDFATSRDFRGKSLSLILLQSMESEMKKRKIRTVFTIARSASPGMNITFARMGYLFGGTLINNTFISTGIESMNIWYKLLDS